MQFFSQHHGKEDLATEALVASMRSLKMCDHLSAFDAHEHQQWCAKILEPHVTVRVGEPESRGSYLKKHTTFLVTQETSQQQIHTGVRRRFSDFEWLHSVLRARYVGMLVPSLPEKTKNVLQSDSFLQSRIRGLTMFLEHVVQSPYMRNDESVARFFTATDEHAWDAAKKETAVMENAGPGHLRWLMLITGESISDSVGAENGIAAFKKQVEQIERSLGDISGCTKRMAEKSAALSKDVSNLHTLFNSWKAVEVATTTHHQDDDEFIKLLDRSTAAVHGWSQVMRFEPAIYELLLHESVKYLLHQVKDMKELLGARDQALQLTVAPQQGAGDPTTAKAVEAPSSSASHPALSKASSTFAAAASSASIFASRFMTTEPSTEELETQQKRARHLRDLITRALISEEIERFRKSKFTALNELMGHFACAEAQLTKRSASMWRESMRASTTDQQALVQSTKQILDATAAHADSSADAY
uniref:PX domain-containing protein n=1 Tax=Globisporangium ultimum (strain ATCC 200006 / CBS 805.95 / DAOM BR144) TaxID=431595 RepID=K3WL75_GLOUD